MELSEIIARLQWRTAVKSFDTQKKVSESDLSGLLEVLRLSPSSLGFQPWKFIVVKDMEIRKRLQVAAHGQPQVVDASEFLVLCSRTSLNQSDVDHYISTIAKVREIKEEDLESFKNVLSGFVNGKTSAEIAVWSAKQMYIALGNLLAMCAVAKIDACPMEGFDVARFNEILGLSESGYTVNAACALGYRSSSDSSFHRKKVRFPIEEVVEVI